MDWIFIVPASLKKKSRKEKSYYEHLEQFLGEPYIFSIFLSKYICVELLWCNASVSLTF